jgi:hypothetical protein
MGQVDIPWSQITIEFQRDMNLLGWNLPEDYFAEGPTVLNSLIEKMLLSKPNQIKELCYRLSIAEVKLTSVITLEDKEQIAPQLTQLIIERCKARIQLRRHFS